MYLITIIHFSGTKLPIQLVPPSAHGTSPALRHSSHTWAIPVEWGFHGKATMNDPWSISRVMFIIHYVYMEGTPIYGKIYSHLWKSSCEILTSTIVFYLKTILFYISEVLYRVLFHDKSEITVTNQNKIWAAKHEGVVTSNQEFGIEWVWVASVSNSILGKVEPYSHLLYYHLYFWSQTWKDDCMDVSVTVGWCRAPFSRVLITYT